VTRGAQLLEWQDWVEPVLAEPLKVVNGVAQPSTVPGSGIAWNEPNIAKCLI
jgi:mandelate racemase